MKLAWGARVSPLFRQRVVALCLRLNIVPDWLMACMAFETGRSFRSDVINKLSGATGLIQFMPSTARGMGTTVEDLARKTPEGQLDDVERYLIEHGASRVVTLADLYMTILWPKAVGQPDEVAIFVEGSSAYAQNAGLDVNKDHQVSKLEAAAFVIKQLEDGLQPGNVAEVELAGAEVPVQPAAPIEEAGTPLPFAAPPKEAPMGIGTILALLPSILGAFSGKAQTQLAPVLSQLGTIVPGAAPPAAGSKEDAIIKFATDIMGMVLGAANVPAATATDAQRIQATATVLAAPDLVQQVEAGTLKRLEALGPTFDRLMAIDKATNEASLAGKDAAAARSRMDAWDMTKALVLSSEGLIWFTMALLCAAIIVQVCLSDSHEPSGVLVGMIGPLLMMVYKNRAQPFDYRFDGTPSSNAANAINAEIASKK